MSESSSGRSATTGTTVAVADPAVVAPPAAGRAAAPGRSRRRAPGSASPLVALAWLGPALLLILGVVIYPAVELVKASLGRYSITGLRLGGAGSRNYTQVLRHPALATVLVNTLVWVVVVVALTILIGLGLAQFLAKEFPGRKAVRWALIVPWAASLVITSRLFQLIYDYYYGIMNTVLRGLHLTSKPIDFLGDDRWTLPSMILVGVFVSLPFSAYVFLAGLHAIPGDLYEAAKLDGARPWQTYWRITLPLLRPALLVATVLNVIYVFNSFPIIYTLNDRNPGFKHDTSITFMYKLAFKSAEHDVGMAAAAGVFNVALILLVVLVYLRGTHWREEVS